MDNNDKNYFWTCNYNLGLIYICGDGSVFFFWDNLLVIKKIFSKKGKRGNWNKTRVKSNFEEQEYNITKICPKLGSGIIICQSYRGPE